MYVYQLYAYISGVQCVSPYKIIRRCYCWKTIIYFLHPNLIRYFNTQFIRSLLIFKIIFFYSRTILTMENKRQSNKRNVKLVKLLAVYFPAKDLMELNILFNLSRNPYYYTLSRQKYFYANNKLCHVVKNHTKRFAATVFKYKEEIFPKSAYKNSNNDFLRAL